MQTIELTNRQRTEAEARDKAREYHCRVFFYQTGPDSFNFRFNSHSPESGVLLAIYNAAGESTTMPREEIDLMQHAVELRRMHGWSADTAMDAMKYYRGHITIEQLRERQGVLTDQITRYR